jgi:hypothetical protein
MPISLQIRLEEQSSPPGSNQGGEFMSNAFKLWTASKGIELQVTPTAAHNQNARVERMHLTLLNNIRTMLAESKLPKAYWIDALRHSIYSRNWIPDASGTTPLERFKPDSGKDIDYHHFHAFGTTCVYRVTKPASKLDPRGIAGRIIGYGTGTTGYTILDTTSGKIVVSRDVQIRALHPTPVNTPEPSYTDTLPVSKGRELHKDDEEEDAPSPESRVAESDSNSDDRPDDGPDDGPDHGPDVDRQHKRLIGCAINQPTMGHYTQLILPIRLPYLLQSPPIQTTIHKPKTPVKLPYLQIGSPPWQLMLSTLWLKTNLSLN